ncbi:hybrid sensor histidine kinase/response regulator [Chachezhania sediminis]|uniref:hybrid sensor histidine kinase/response regulator n=1 Tax=Chachezhania sediminis TaxID=2599291 RepID=UPI00131E924D|nr:PAS domain-containing hybrid sensor histidine kinase/response regulator [Chachezhania sediminis]
MVLLVFCMGTVAGLGWLVLRGIDAFNTANSDNLQWVLAQTDVEFLRFKVALLEAQRDPEKLAAVRRRFDIFYSRMSTLENGVSFRRLRDDADFDAPRAVVRSFLDDTVALIDGSDNRLEAALPALLDQAVVLEAAIRKLSLAGLTSFAQVSDSRREEVADTLILMATVLGLLLGGLTLLALSFYRLYRVSERQARDVARTGSRMRTIVETTVDAILVCDDRGKVIDLNGAAEALFGYDRTEAVGMNAIKLVHPPDIRAELLENQLRYIREHRRPERSERRFESEAITRTGRRFAAEISLDRADDAGERVFVVFVRDISGRKAAEAELLDARDKALAGETAKAEFLAVMSHEMRTPLNGLLGTMQLLRDHKLTEKQSDLLDQMQNSGRQLLGLVNDVLDLAKYEAGKLVPEQRPFEVSRLLEGVVETTSTLATNNGNTLHWSCSLEPGSVVLGDSRRLRQVLLNLVGNAIKFTRHGEIWIEAEKLTGPGHMAEFRVMDTGVGISARNLERIFNDFETLDSSYSRQAGGTGLGLGIARRLTELMGGEIGVESEEGEGSLFWVRVALPPAADLPAQQEPFGHLRDGAGRAVRPLSALLVEDNEINRFVAREMLKAEGHDVTEAVDGQAGVALAAARAFDVILMDISMPVMDGQAAARAIRSGGGASARAPIIAVTAHALPEEVARFREAGMEYCISKPVDRAELVGMLAAIAAGGTPDGQGGPVVTGARLFDEGYLESMRDLLKPEEVDRLARKFLAETDLAVADLKVAAVKDPHLAARAHACAGSCAAFGLTGMHHALAGIETAAKTGTLSQNALKDLALLWEKSRDRLVVHLDG